MKVFFQISISDTNFESFRFIMSGGIRENVGRKRDAISAKVRRVSKVYSVLWATYTRSTVT